MEIYKCDRCKKECDSNGRYRTHIFGNRKREESTNWWVKFDCYKIDLCLECIKELGLDEIIERKKIIRGNK